MRIKYILILSILNIFASYGQTYMSGGASIPDHGVPLQIIIPVSGLDSANINSNYGLEQICIDINHTSVHDLAIYVMSPNGTNVELSSGNGGTADNYTSTCFDMNATQLITSGTPPYTGSYIPEHSFGVFNDGQAGNGLWRLIVTDYLLGDTGSVIQVSLHFGYNPPPPISVSVGPCNDFSPAGCVCADGDSSCWLMPDIITATSMLQDTFWQREVFNMLRVTNSCANIGYGPMEIVGTGIWVCNDSIVSGPGRCPDSTFAKQKITQRVFVKNAGVGFFDFKDTLVGTMQFHSDLGHNHLHVDDWTVNTLRLRGPGSDASKWPIVGSGNKVSFCIYDHLVCGGTFKNCQYYSDMNLYASLPNNGLGNGFTTCGTAVQGMSVGYSDIYDWSLAGQEVVFDSLCNGNYYLVSEFDPNKRFVDGNRTNNVSVVPVTLKQQISGCCKSNFRIDTIDYNENIYQFVDLSIPIPDHWFWDFGNGITDTTQFPIVNYNDSLLYTIKLIISNNSGCIDSSTQNILINRDFSDTCRNTYDISANSGTWNLFIDLLGDTSSIDSIQVNVIDSTANVYYLSNSSFYIANQGIVNINLHHIIDTMFITVYYKNSCRYTFKKNYYLGYSNIDDVKSQYAINIQPNPATLATNLIFNLPSSEMVHIELFNIYGQHISTILPQTLLTKGYYTVEVPLLNSGIYYLHTTFGKNEHIDKIFSY